MQMNAFALSRDLEALSRQEDALTRRRNLSTATENQIKELAHYDEKGPDSIVWKGIGKMFLSTPISGQLQEMASERTQYKEQLDALSKKKYYLETTQTNLTNALSSLSVKK